MKTTHDNGTSTREQLLLNAAFFLLFPGFFYYHTLLGTGATGAFLGGYFSPISLLCMLPLLLAWLRRMRHDPRRLSSLDLHYGLFNVYFLAVVAVNAVAGANRTIVAHHVLGILFMVNTFALFSLIDFGHRQFRVMALASLAAMSAIVFSFSTGGVFYLGALGMAKDADALATYQGFSRSYLMTFLPVLAYTRSLPLRLVLYAVGAATLFVNTARSEFAALLFAIPIVELYFSRHKLLFVGLALLAGVVLAAHLDDLVAMLPDNRILELLDLSHSTSANKRHHLTLYARQTIAAHPLMGAYASYAPGYYSHNVLSAWVDLGLFGFVYLLAITALPAIPMFFKEFLAGRRRTEFILGFALACVTLLLLVSSHYFTDMLVGATLGAYSQYRFERKHGKHRPPDLSPSPLRHADLRQAMPQPERSGA
ncbi:hypothetical protein QPK32_24045 [Massilia sp. YIM B02763]|uniref:hypothetical protein n=1 Tax=Massilia sp. YIM B02763 TaxID=3050130 RepID=UPI0025B6E2C7|nr:hypothetical protein [Massilia sp. YIM B02763]MDN4056141.1 hypothetical protein [Massilia sp. YIM B02763]